MEKKYHTVKITYNSGGVLFDTIKADSIEELQEKLKRKYPFAKLREVVD